MLTYNNQFELELMKLIDERIAHITDTVMLGMAVVDYADYKYQIGQIAGLKSIIELSGEVNTILSQR
mgnify:CR=1 FL=1